MNIEQGDDEKTANGDEGNDEPDVDATEPCEDGVMTHSSPKTRI